MQDYLELTLIIQQPTRLQNQYYQKTKDAKIEVAFNATIKKLTACLGKKIE